jgi:hypothetical protein
LFAVAALAGCASTHTAIAWSGDSIGEQSRIELDNHGIGHFTATTKGEEEDSVDLALDKTQLHELADMYRTHHVCSLVHDPKYAPQTNEGQTTLELNIEDLNCKVTLYDLEWEKADKDLVDTMHSMRPKVSHKQKQPRKLDPRGASQ